MSGHGALYVNDTVIEGARGNNDTIIDIAFDWMSNTLYWTTM